MALEFSEIQSEAAMHQAIGRRFLALIEGELEFAAKKGGKGKGGANKKDCKKGISCGSSCVAKTKACVSEMSASQKKRYYALLRKVKKGGAGGGEAQAEIDKIIADQVLAKTGQQPEVVPVPVVKQEKKKALPRKIVDAFDVEEFSISKQAGGDTIEVRTFLTDLNETVGKIKGDGTNHIWGHEVAFYVNDKLDKGTSNNPVRSAMVSIKTVENDVIPNLPENSVVINKPYSGDGFGSQRAALYKKRGFGDVGDSGFQFAILQGGKLVPVSESDLKKRV